MDSKATNVIPYTNSFPYWSIYGTPFCPIKMCSTLISTPKTYIWQRSQYIIKKMSKSIALTNPIKE